MTREPLAYCEYVLCALLPTSLHMVLCSSSSQHHLRAVLQKQQRMLQQPCPTSCKLLQPLGNRPRAAAYVYSNRRSSNLLPCRSAAASTQAVSHSRVAQEVALTDASALQSASQPYINKFVKPLSRGTLHVVSMRNCGAAQSSVLPAFAAEGHSEFLTKGSRAIVLGSLHAVLHGDFATLVTLFYCTAGNAFAVALTWLLVEQLQGQPHGLLRPRHWGYATPA